MINDHKLMLCGAFHSIGEAGSMLFGLLGEEATMEPEDLAIIEAIAEQTNEQWDKLEALINKYRATQEL